MVRSKASGVLIKGRAQPCNKVADCLRSCSKWYWFATGVCSNYTATLNYMAHSIGRDQSELRETDEWCNGGAAVGALERQVTGWQRRQQFLACWRRQLVTKLDGTCTQDLLAQLVQLNKTVGEQCGHFAATCPLRQLKWNMAIMNTELSQPQLWTQSVLAYLWTQSIQAYLWA